jgi:hypothetical protein
VTSFHEEAYSYAKDCLSTLEKHFPGKIVAYIEGGSYDHPKVEFRDFWAINGVKDYLEKLKRHPGGDGVLNGKYDFRYDANKFCRKVFAQDAVFDEDQYVFWFDADCIVKKPIPEPLLVSLVEKPFAYLGRGANSYTETGWLGFNTKHRDFSAFRGKYLPYFTTGRIFSQLKGWHDCIAFDYAREGIEGNNLTPRGMAMDSVIQDSPIGKYVAHLKGPRKFSDKHKRDALA